MGSAAAYHLARSGRQVLGIDRFRIHVSNRLVLNGLLEELSLAAQAVPLLRALDKLPKVGRGPVIQEMADKAGVPN